MQPHLLEREQFIARPLDDVFAFFSNASNLERVTPPWLSFRILSTLPIEMAVGTRIAYQIGWHFVRLNWISEIVDWKPNQSFTDVQVRGPYAEWHHTHTFREHKGGTQMRDCVRYRLPLGVVGHAVNTLKVRRDLDAIFDYRAAQIKGILSPQGHAPTNSTNCLMS